MLLPTTSEWVGGPLPWLCLLSHCVVIVPPGAKGVGHGWSEDVSHVRTGNNLHSTTTHPYPQRKLCEEQTYQLIFWISRYSFLVSDAAISRYHCCYRSLSPSRGSLQLWSRSSLLPYCGKAEKESENEASIYNLLLTGDIVQATFPHMNTHSLVPSSLWYNLGLAWEWDWCLHTWTHLNRTYQRFQHPICPSEYHTCQCVWTNACQQQRGPQQSQGSWELEGR